VDWRYQVAGRDVTEQIRRMFETTERLTQVQRDQENARRAALDALHEAGLSQRTIADALGVSHQRVNQLLKAS
jgi:predicted XRE-type DNA-binding protein